MITEELNSRAFTKHLKSEQVPQIKWLLSKAGEKREKLTSELLRRDKSGEGRAVEELALAIY